MKLTGLTLVMFAIKPYVLEFDAGTSHHEWKLCK